MDWVDVGSMTTLPQGGTQVEVAGHCLAVFRIGDDVYVIGDRCSHAEASLAEGELFDDDVECPRHGSEFNIKTGEPGSLPATRPVPTYQVVIDEDVVRVALEPIEEEQR